MICTYCKKEKIFEDKYKEKHNKYCKLECYWKSMIGKCPRYPPPHNIVSYKTCSICNKLFRKKRRTSLYCSRKCAGISLRNKSLTDRICKICKNSFTIIKCNKKKICSEECKKKSYHGEYSNSWKGGIKKDKDRRKSYESVCWRESVFKRDNYTCRDCGLSGVYLEAHHIKSYAKYPELRTELSNGITLCKECHKLTDNFGAKGQL